MIINVLKVFDIILSVAPGLLAGRGQRRSRWRCGAPRSAGSTTSASGSAIAVFLFILVIPVLLLNIRRFRREV